MIESRTKYGSISTVALIRAIQESHQMIAEPHWQTKVSAKRNKQIRQELGEMRVEVIDRLSTLDRTKQDFFPVHSLIFYDPDPDNVLGRRGKVMKHAKENKLLIQCDGDSYCMEVEPRHCTLLFIRTAFLS